MPRVKLPKEKKEALLKAERILHDLVPDIKAGEECGIDCTEAKQHFDYLRAQLAKIRQHFGSGGPS